MAALPPAASAASCQTVALINLKEKQLHKLLYTYIFIRKKCVFLINFYRIVLVCFYYCIIYRMKKKLAS